MDWSVGEYERTAAVLSPVSEVALDAARLRPDEVVLDLGTGTGNAAMAAARRGAAVTGVDPAGRLLEVARGRAVAEGHQVRFLQGNAVGLPVADATADLVLSVFGVIFENDGPGAIAEISRVLRPGGRVVLTSWTSDGPVLRIGQVLKAALQKALGSPLPEATDWSDEVVLRVLLGAYAVSIERHELTFTAGSPAAWFAEQEEYHPIWRQLRVLLEDADWDAMRAESVAILSEANEDPEAFAVTCGYWLVRADSPA